MPVLVVCAGGWEPHAAQQRDLLRLSSNSKFVQVNADHMGMLVNHDQAALVISEIEAFIASL